MSDNIRCPQCSFEFEPSEALSAQLRQELTAQFEAAARQREAQLTAEAKQKEQLLLQREAEFRKKESTLEQQRLSLDEEVQAKLAKERAQLAKEALAKAKEDYSLRFTDLEVQLHETKSKLLEAQTAELELRKKGRELEEQKRELAITVERTLDQEREKIRAAAKLEEAEQRQLKEAEKDKRIADLNKNLDELKRKLDQGSQQTQGEVLELELEELLRAAFPFDTIEPVPKGVHGGDVLQIVHDATSAECGRILWESKRTKNWSDGWLPKLRDDQRAAKAQFAVLASIEMPKGCTTFTLLEGVWVTNRACVLGVAMALRSGLVEISQAKRSVEGRQGKMELLYSYLAGAEFRHRVSGIVEGFVAMKEDLEAEKKAMQRIWAKREKQLERAINSAAGMHGDLAGIIGSKLPALESLDLLAITEENASRNGEK